MKFLSLILWLGGLCTDANDADNANINNYARRTNHDYIGSFGRKPNEPKTVDFKIVKATSGKLQISLTNYSLCVTVISRIQAFVMISIQVKYCKHYNIV